LKVETRHKVVLACFQLNIVVLAFGVIKLKWFITEIAGLFTLLGIVIAFIGRLSAGAAVNAFLKGAAGLISGSLIIGVARAIVVILTDGHVIDTILYHASAAIHHMPPSLSVVGMYLALTMPIMAQLADLVGVTRQTAVLCFSMADGIGNIIFPTSSYFMAGLAIAGIPWSCWAKSILPFILTQYAIGLVAVIAAQLMSYGPF